MTSREYVNALSRKGAVGRMCLPCIEPLINAWDRINPFKKARQRMLRKVQDSKEEEFDRDNVVIPFILEEKRSVLKSDPGVPDYLHASGSSNDVVLTMKKVSSLGLV